MNLTDITSYTEMAARRKWYIIIPFLLTSLAGLTYLLITPKVYEAETLIVVQSQKVPEDYVRSIVSSDVRTRLRTITQEVTSRTNLEKIIREFDLFRGFAEGVSIDQMVGNLRKRIVINVSGGRSGAEAFNITFQDKDPKTAMEVTNSLASNFITENLKIRESQALGTSSFLSEELVSMEKNLSDKEEELRQYNEKHMGGLPEQLDTNLRVLERLQSQLDQINNNLRDAETRKIMIETQIAEQQEAEATSIGSVDFGDQGPRDLMSLKNELASLESRYTQNHPDVVRLKKMIETIEEDKTNQTNDTDENISQLSSVSRNLRRQRQDVIYDIKALKEEMGKTKLQIKVYQQKVEETPKREQELLSLKRDYQNLRGLYNSLLNRKLEAEIAVSMEKKQKGEQFRIIDRAKIPSHPVEPNARKIILITIAFGLGLGGGLAFLMETLNTSYKSPEEIKEEIELPILVTLPITHTEAELKKTKWKNIFAYTATGLLFSLAVFSILTATKGFEKTLEFLSSLFTGG